MKKIYLISLIIAVLIIFIAPVLKDYYTQQIPEGYYAVIQNRITNKAIAIMEPTDVFVPPYKKMYFYKISGSKILEFKVKLKKHFGLDPVIVI